MNSWNQIYTHFDPVAFYLFGIGIHWYGIMYALALGTALMVGKWLIKRDNIAIDKEAIGDFFLWVEIGVILGARLWYVLFYDTHTAYYLSHPWQIFNPFMDGQFVGIRGMSYHGALVGFLVAAFLFTRRRKQPFFVYMDLVALSVPLGYVFGRIGNFLNQELVGKETTVSWGIYVYDTVTLRHPSQLYEAFLEGVVVFVILMAVRHRVKIAGILTFMYGILYALARFVAEFWREPDVQLGYLYGDWLSMGQLQSLIMMAIALAGLVYAYRRGEPRATAIGRGRSRS